MMKKPFKGEYNPHYDQYIALVPHEDILEALRAELISTAAFFRAVPQAKENFAYATNKWTIKQVLQHIVDTERIFMYRALCFARGEEQELPGYDENKYAAALLLDNVSLGNIVEEYESVRKSTILFLEHLDDSLYSATGIANKSQVTVQALAAITAGHELHHIQVIQERYF